MIDLQRTKYLRDLRRQMIKHFDLEELEILAFDLAVDWDELSGEKKSSKIQSFIMTLSHRGRLLNLLEILQEERSSVEWPEVPSPEQQIADELTLNPENAQEYLFQEFIDKMTILIKDNQILMFGKEAEGVAVMKRHAFGYYGLPPNAAASARAYISSYFSRLNKPHHILAIKFLSDSWLPSLIDLRNSDLSAANFADLNLSDADFSGTDFSKANLSGTRLDRASLKESNLQGTDLTGASLAEIKLQNAKYNTETKWPKGFKPESYDLLLVK